MRFPPSESLGYVLNAEGARFRLHFYGENEGAAVITGPIPENTGRMVAVEEFHREPAVDALDARAKLGAELRRLGGFRPAS